MSHLRLFKLTTLLVPTACALAACGSSESRTPTTTSSGGEGGSVTYDSTASSGPGGLSSASESSGTGTVIPDPTPNCIGDAGAWKELTAGPLACTSGEDCCVIMNPCHAEAQIVAKEHAAEALEVWPSCATDCTDCVARAIEVACVEGACLGRVIAEEESSSPLRKDHCGASLEFVKTNGGPTAVQFSCGGGNGP